MVMKRNMMQRTTLREIRSTFGRFFAILSIIALGVGFFAGVRITTPSMIHTVNALLQEKQFYDYRLISTLGWEQTDVEAFQAMEGVRCAEGVNSLDVLCTDKEGTEFVLKTQTVPQQINQLMLTEGRMPEQENECIMDAAMGSLHVGDVIRVASANDQDTKEALCYQEFKIVGSAHTSYYLNFERGTTSIGTGSAAGFLYILPEAYDRDYFTEIFVRFEQDDMIYSQHYKDAMADRSDTWESLTQKQAENRYDRLLADAEAELQDGKDELEEKRTEGQQELDDAKQELADGRQELDDAAKELTDAEQELADAKKELNDAQKELNDAKQELADGQKELDDSKKTLDDAKSALDASEQQLLDGEAQVQSAQAQLDSAAAELHDGETALNEGENQLAVQEQELNAQLAQVQPMWDMLPEEQKAQLEAAQRQLEAAKAELNEKRTELETGRQELNANQETLNVKKAELAAGRAEFEKGRADYESGLRQYEEALETFNKGKADYEDGLKQYEEGLAEYADGQKSYEEGKQEYENGEKEYADGLTEYEDGRQEFDEKIADAEQEIADAEQELADLEKPDTYVLDRNTNIGYACFESDSQIVEQVARVFPVFFILVAVLVCMTTMSRMVEEQRTQIGVLKALGYSNAAIMGKFLFYSGSASLIGCIVGYAVGTLVFPTVIWMSYQLMYIPMSLVYVFDWKLALTAVVVSLLCSMGTTWAACRIELNETAASLMRPKAPKAGTRVFLEYIPFVWNRLKFLYKVSIRNIFRYKGRFFMMIVGISGCTALLLTGFGLKDSVAGFADVQYEEIQVADTSLVLKTGIGTELPSDLRDQLDTQTEDYMPVHEASWDLLMEDGRVKSMSLIVPFDSANMDKYMHLRTMDGEKLSFPQTGEAVVSNSIAERYSAEVGDTITLRDEGMQELQLKVTGIFENHVYNYIILSPETMTAQLGEVPEFNTVYVNFSEGTDVYQTAAELANSEFVTNMLIYEDMKVRLSNMMKSLDYIVLLVIVCAAGLAFIVLYNLTNINITERIREIATIKVLGFFRKETSAYVLRENLVLTILGILAGLGFGILLHRFVIEQIVVDMVSFRIRILPMSFVYSILLTLGFNVIVNAFMGIKLERINMAESLKSVD